MSDPKRLTPPFGVLLMAYGSPATLRDVKAYYTHIRGGRTPPAEQVAELRARYERIGGRSPLLEITWRQAAGVVQALGQAGLPARAYVGMRSEEHTSELQSRGHLVCRLLLEKKNKTTREA